jgi:hypothetical protein
MPFCVARWANAVRTRAPGGGTRTRLTDGWPWPAPGNLSHTRGLVGLSS